MDRRHEALSLAEETLAALEIDGARLTPIVLRCLRIARLLDNKTAEAWCNYELHGYQDALATDQNSGLYASWSGRHANKDANGAWTYWIAPIEQIESMYEMARENLRALPIPVTSVSESAPVSQPIHYPAPLQSTSEKLLNSILSQRAASTAEATKWLRVIASLRGSLHHHLAATVVELRYGRIVDTVFERARNRFDRLLSEIAPDAAAALSAAFARGDGNDPETQSQALTSCRRSLKALADALYPPREPIDGHVLDADHFVNRLTQYAKENLQSRSRREALDEEIASVARRAEALNDLASKGIHNEVSREELELVVVRTYVLAGELLGLLPEPPNVDRAVELSDIDSEASVAVPRQTNRRGGKHRRGTTPANTVPPAPQSPPPS